MTKGHQTQRVPNLTYSLAPDLEIIPLPADEWLCVSAAGRSRIGGLSARLLIEHIMPLLTKGCRWSHLVAQLPAVAPHELRRVLDDLVVRGILRCSPGAPPACAPTLSPLLTLLDALHLSTAVATERLAHTRIAIIGLEGVGAHLAVLLARCGVQRFTLVDPYPCQPGNLPLLPVGGPAALGRPRQAVIAAALRAAHLARPEGDLILGPPTLAADDVARLVAGCDCVVSCFDRGFAAIHHWVNRACLRAGVPAVYAEASGLQGWAGPLVLPQKTACYMCYRMRAVACTPDITAALAYEEYLDRQNHPRQHTRAVLPSLMPQLAGLLATVVLQVILDFEQPPLAGRVLECQALTLATALHPVVQQPGCPDCGAGAPPEPDQPDLAALPASSDPAVDVLQVGPELVSSQTGLIREVRWYEKDAAEPVLPYICQVTLANHHFQSTVVQDDLTCWGKGLTYPEARASGLGEAIERYAADWVDPATVIYARRADLDGPSLDPADLVLYAPAQYTTVPYHPYAETSTLGWVRGRSLVSGQPVYLPALATFLGYQAQSPAEHLCPVTSNGLAAGAGLLRAILAAIYEVLERDAFMITWLARLPAGRIDPLTHPDAAIRALCVAYARRGIEIGLWRLPTDHPGAVFLALGLQPATGVGPAVVAGLGADLAPAAAARKAILEVGQIHPSYRRSLRRPSVLRRLAALVADPQRVTTMHDHGLLYCSPIMRPALAFLLDRTPEPAHWTPVSAGDPATQLARLVTYFRAAQQEVLYYNLTPPDLARWGLAATRVILPGFQPVAFGAQQPRLGGDRLYELPQQLGLAPTRLTRADLNPDPHPFD